MIRRQNYEMKTNHERWLVSYSDFITLLFAFFVVMYSVSHVSQEKYKTLSETLNAAFSTQNNTPSEPTASAQDAEVAALEDLASAIEEQLDSLPVEGDIQLSANENWVELTLSSELLFASGKAKPNNDARRVFAELADLLAPFSNEIQVSGHTDDIPISNEDYESNWALSSARAIAIVNELAFQGVNPSRLSAAAFGEHRPVADNSTEEGRALNRRVVVRVASNAVDAPAQPPEDVIGDLERAPEDSIESVSSANDGERTQSAQENLESPRTVEPVRLKGGDLLFTSDPNLPRLREREEESTNQ